MNPTHKPKQIHKACNEAGLKVLLPVVYRDLQRIERESTFVSDLAKKNYSNFVESRIKRMIKAADVLEDILDNTDDVKTKLQAARILHMCEGDLVKIVSTDVLRVSASAWAKYTKELEAQIALLRHHNGD